MYLYIRMIIVLTITALFINGCETDPTEPEPEKESLVQMVLVEGGTFTMGDTWGDGSDNEIPTHSVTLNSLYISKYEITQAEYLEVMDSNPSEFIGESRPVERVTWYDAATFCNKLSEREGLVKCYVIDGGNTTCDFSANGYRLPTEAEWEYTARGGNQSMGYKYSGSNNLDDVAWYAANSGSQIHEVGLKAPNELGIYDMSGNVREWCWDWLSAYTAEAQTNPTGPAIGDLYRLLRGGSWHTSEVFQRVSSRNSYSPSANTNFYGFRISRTK